jgi:hypothetical protein
VSEATWHVDALARLIAEDEEKIFRDAIQRTAVGGSAFSRDWVDNRAQKIKEQLLGEPMRRGPWQSSRPTRSQAAVYEWWWVDRGDRRVVRVTDRSPDGKPGEELLVWTCRGPEPWRLDDPNWDGAEWCPCVAPA